MTEYADLLIRIRRWDVARAAYPIEAALGDGSRFEGGQLRLDQATLLAQELDSAAYGQTLFDALFSGDLLRAYERAIGSAAGRVRVRLWVDNDAVELHALPWERVYHLSRGNLVPLAISTDTPLSRYTSLETPEPTPVTERPLKLLVAIANPNNLPQDLAPVDLASEVNTLLVALGDLSQKQQVQVTLLPGYSGLPATVSAQVTQAGWQVIAGNTDLDRIMRYLPGSHIFHFIGHGLFKRAEAHGAGQAWLIGEDEDGARLRISDSEISAKFAASGQLPHLAYFVACESAKRDAQAEHPFIGLGPKLVQAGVPAVIAMQQQVPIDLARELSAEFYRRLLEHGLVDQALSQARLIVFDPKSTEWAIPVLFSRLPSGELFVAKKTLEHTNQPASVVQNITVHEGGVNFNSNNVNIGGNVAARDISKNNVTTFVSDSGSFAKTPNSSLITSLFVKLKVRVKDLPNPDIEKEELKNTIRKIQDEIKKGDVANATEIASWLTIIKRLSLNMHTATVEILINPELNLAASVQEVAHEAKGETH